MKSDKKTLKHKKGKKVRQPVAEIKKQIRPSRSINSVYVKIKGVLDEARNNAYRAVNFAMVQAYWHIGRIVVEEEQKGEKRAGYGVFLIKELSKRLTVEFGTGFSETNLKYFRQFYLTFPNGHAMRDELRGHTRRHSESDESLAAPNLQLLPHLSWTHYRLLLRVDNHTARDFYMEECVKGNWSTRQLERQINSFYYERLLASKQKKLVKKEAQKTANQLKSSPHDVIKDPYILEFLGLKEDKKYLESEFESAIIDKLQAFLLELGRGFSFVARQQRISTETQDFYIDLVFYNYLLNCFVLIDLKIGKLAHQDIGQMDMYVKMYEDKVKPPEANPTIGIILCSDKDETMVQYSVLKGSKRLFASKYKLYLPTEEELKREIARDREIIEMERKQIAKRKKK